MLINKKMNKLQRSPLSSRHWAVSISWDSWYKCRKTGGKRKPCHKKWKYELSVDPAANTKTGPHHIHIEFMLVGSKKNCALRLNTGNFSWVLYTQNKDYWCLHVSNNELVLTKTLVKNCIVLIASTPYCCKVVWVPLGTAPGPQEGDQGDSWGDRDLKQTDKQTNKNDFKNSEEKALAGVAQWIERWPANQKAASLIPGWGTCLGCGPGPRSRACERQPVDVSLSLSLKKKKGPGRQIILLPPILCSCSKGVYCSFKNCSIVLKTLLSNIKYNRMNCWYT